MVVFVVVMMFMVLMVMVMFMVMVTVIIWRPSLDSDHIEVDIAQCRLGSDDV